MKKTLAAVLAAAMALSTASVAFATDYEITDPGWTSGGVDEDKHEIRYGKDVKIRITTLDVEGGVTISADELAEKIDNGDITLTPVVTEGSPKLASKPSVTVGTWKEGTGTIVHTIVYSWQGNEVTIAGVTFKTDKKVSKVPIDINGDVTDDPALAVGWADTKKLTSAQASSPLLKQVEVTTSEGTQKNDGVQVKFKVADTYQTGDTNIGIKFRITIKKKGVELDGQSYSKGDTLTSDEIKFKAVYGELNSYDEDMQLTLDEVDARNVKFDASDLYDQIGNDTFTIAFEDTAVFEAKLSASQKDLNLYYDVDEKTDVTSAYPNVDFDFITFRGNPSFVNSGEMTFNAIGGKNTTVYTFDGETLNPLNSTYDSTYGTVTVKGIKKLGTFVVASEILEVEDEEDNEPVSSAPIVEEPSSSQPSSNNGDRNPSTGAC